MSTLNVANISDDQSTLSNSANPNDSLNNTTTVDTKFVTNGSAKVQCNFSDSAISSSLNVSSVDNNSLGNNTVSITSNMSLDRYQLTATGGSHGHAIIQTFYDDYPDRYTMKNLKFVSGAFDESDVRMGTVIHGDLA